jgi:hypothetical protein
MKEYVSKERRKIEKELLFYLRRYRFKVLRIIGGLQKIYNNDYKRKI